PLLRRHGTFRRSGRGPPLPRPYGRSRRLRGGDCTQLRLSRSPVLPAPLQSRGVHDPQPRHHEYIRPGRRPARRRATAGHGRQRGWAAAGQRRELRYAVGTVVPPGRAGLEPPGRPASHRPLERAPWGPGTCPCRCGQGGVMRLEFLGPDDRPWQEVLREVPHDFYHLPGYAHLCATQDGGQAEATLIREGGNAFFLPYVVRSIAGEPELAGLNEHFWDLHSPYGYPCPLLREHKAGSLRVPFGRWVEARRAREVVSGFLRLPPLVSAPADVLGAFGSVVRRGSTVSVDLTLREEAIWHGVRGNHRTNIERLRRKGFTVTVDQDPGTLEEFAAIYRETMDRVGAADSYHFPPSYFGELSRVLGEKLWITAVRDPNGALAAGALLVECGSIVQYHLGGTRGAFLALAPSKLLFDHAWRWARERGRPVLDLGGGVGRRGV